MTSKRWLMNVSDYTHVRLSSSSKLLPSATLVVLLSVIRFGGELGGGECADHSVYSSCPQTPVFSKCRNAKDRSWDETFVSADYITLSENDLSVHCTSFLYSLS